MNNLKWEFQEHMRKVIAGIITAFVIGIAGEIVASLPSLEGKFAGGFSLYSLIRLGTTVLIIFALGGIFQSLKFVVSYYFTRGGTSKTSEEVDPTITSGLAILYILVLGSLFFNSFESIFYWRWVSILSKAILVLIVIPFIFNFIGNIRSLISKGSMKLAERMTQISEKMDQTKTNKINSPVKCPKCGVEIPPETKFCPNCGESLTKKEEKNAG